MAARDGTQPNASSQGLAYLPPPYCRSDGRIEHLAEDGKQHVKLFNCNFDFTYAEHFHTARFGPGAFIKLLELLFTESTGRQLEIIKHGEPGGFTNSMCDPRPSPPAGALH